MDSKAIRQKFLNYFINKKHQIVESAPLVNKNDPTLMFTNAGMNQFKDFFLGNEKPKYTRIADTQKCLRVSGKHNDLEEVGLDTYHHTMFEMLGNWSFGDYFKKEAIEWAWELLTEVYKLPKDKLYVTVFEGDKSENLELDQEAYDLWKNIIDEDRIIYGSKKDNFWEMGDTGPCGPCSEIHIDLRSDEEIKAKPGKELVNNDHPQVVEIWNLVFMEFNRMASGELKNLPAKHVDTGMGFERLCMAIQNKKSNYDTDVFEPLISFLADKANVKYGNNEQTDIALRVISDHVRAIAFAVADGQLPSNTGAGYVIRRILRRAVRYGFTFLGFKEPIIYKLVKILDSQMGDVFNELRAQVDFISKVIEQEEVSFLKTLDSGLLSMGREIERLVAKQLLLTLSRHDVKYSTPVAGGWNLPDLILPDENIKLEIKNDLHTKFSNINTERQIGDETMLVVSLKDILTEDLGQLFRVEKLQNVRLKVEDSISGQFAFQLYDTQGFPFDLTSLIARENGLSVDEKGFAEEMAKQKERSKADAVKETGDWTILKKVDKVEFEGYDHLTSESTIVQYRTIKQKDKEIYQIVLDKTPFYAESGGQVGDNGYLESDTERLKVLDTKKENDLIVHLVEKLPANVAATFKAIVNKNKRVDTMSNHSATHLLHFALREILGTHVEQKGSLVNEKILRFDFSHFQKLTDEEIHSVEHIVNSMIRQNISLDERRNVPIAKAKEMGAMALFGEKYGEEVRVIKFDNSVELCGGTHVSATGNIGYFKIVSEGSIAAGVRRIEAITGKNAENYMDEQVSLLNEIKSILKSPKDIKLSIQQLVEEKNQLEKDIQQLHAGKAQDAKKELLASKVDSNGAVKIVSTVNLPSADALKQLCFELKNEVEDLFLVLAANIDGKPQISVVLGDKLINEKGMNAGNIVRELAQEIKGGGGGQPFYATAGGKDISGLDRVVEKANQLI